MHISKLLIISICMNILIKQVIVYEGKGSAGKLSKLLIHKDAIEPFSPNSKIQ